MTYCLSGIKCCTFVVHTCPPSNHTDSEKNLGRLPQSRRFAQPSSIPAVDIVVLLSIHKKPPIIGRPSIGCSLNFQPHVNVLIGTFKALSVLASYMLSSRLHCDTNDGHICEACK